MYAIGEISLVVIGILLALAINNWWQEKNEHQLERIYLQALLADIRVDIDNINKYQLRSLERITKPMERAIGAFIVNDPTTVDTLQFINDVAMVSYMNIILYRRGTYKDLMSTGNLNLISSNELKSAMHDYVEKSEFYTQYYEAMLDLKMSSAEIINKYVPARYLYDHFDFLEQFKTQEVHIELSTILNNRILENTIITGLGMVEWRDNSYKDMLDQAEHMERILMSQLETNLNKGAC